MHFYFLAVSLVGRVGVEGMECIRVVLLVRQLVQIVSRQFLLLVLDCHSRASVSFANLSIHLIYHYLVGLDSLGHEGVFLDDCVQVNRRSPVRIHGLNHDARVLEAILLAFCQAALGRGRELLLQVRSFGWKDQTTDVTFAI